MTIYAESSAVLAWLFEEEGADAVVQCFQAAQYVVSSDLTLVECERVLIRSTVTDRLSEVEVERRRAQLEAASSAWSFVPLERGLLERCCRRFPLEPLRTLDALHLASAAAARRHFPGLGLLSLDHRVRENATALGFPLLPT